MLRRPSDHPAVLSLARMLAAAVTALAVAPPVAAAESGPFARTTAAVGVTDTAATLTGVIGGGHGATPYRFEWGTATYDHVSSGSVGPAETDTTVSAAVTGLTPGTRYRFRLVALGAGPAGVGANQSFTTLPAAPASP